MTRPRKTFNSYDVLSEQFELFFQIGDCEENCLVKVLDVSSDGFEKFEASKRFSKDEFLQYLGLIKGVCTDPLREDISEDEDYKAFSEKYKIKQNKVSIANWK